MQSIISKSIVYVILENILKNIGNNNNSSCFIDIVVILFYCLRLGYCIYIVFELNHTFTISSIHIRVLKWFKCEIGSCGQCFFCIARIC